MNKELVSVVMSTYNEPEEWIRKSIESILNQTHINIEFIIVCDNPNNFKLVNILNEYKNNDKRIVLIINKENLGLSKSLNKAIKLASGKFIARMDSDDIALENRIDVQLNYLKDYNLDLIGSGVSCIDENECEISNLNNFPINDKKVRSKVIYNNCIPHPTWIGKSIVFKDNKGYREIPYAEDYDFILRALEKGYKFGNIDSILLKYRIRSSSISNKNGLKQFLVSRYLVKLFKQNIINSDINIILNGIYTEFDNITKEDENKYYIASANFTDGLMKIKRMNFIGIIDIIKAVVNSNYYRKKIICYIRGLL